ncbi:amylo-alpha-1,6-glucosidase [Sellimonas caecigallum]|uniref:Bacterial alpha-L-rhamnosidase n=1 Tax=Sellimonas caecigallum TaxID=2592333 RepID=A0ABS7L9D1_9FIRM|nr:amylo-alpha-1,6-glucosidase [Sellimonas caecigallum]MBY0759649.1 Bacterial alpha-L-rhamnosidase [Sellimonas caecigallum]
MKWLYGKQDFKTLERGQENCYLLTNGLGGFSSLTMTGSASRNDHAFLMACKKAPNHRYNLVHRLKEELCIGDRTVTLSSQEFADGTKEEGFRFLSSFSFEDSPVWEFLVKGITIRKEIGMAQGENTTAVRYEIANHSRKDAVFSVTPFLKFTPKGKEPEKGQGFVCEGKGVRSLGQCLFFETNGKRENQEKEEQYFYSYDACDGRTETGRSFSVFRIRIDIPAGKTAVLDMTCSDLEERSDAGKIIDEMKAYRRKLEEKSGFRSPAARMLAKSADQFISRRESTDGKTILAGFPFFEDWGRDTMIALPGVCISTGQYDAAKEILRTFAVHEKDGLMPNLFPEGGTEPMYNTVDAALLFINCVYLYYKAAKDTDFVREVWPVMERIVEKYREGTHYGIRMDEDGLILAGEDLWQVTWMDVRVGEILPTPRHGKPVEINAYWYNALCIMELFASMIGKDYTEYRKLAKKAKDSFRKKFWMDDRKCLKDLISGTKADTQVRCNQIWAVSMPFTMLEPEREKQIVETVFETLYTPYGLRTLEEADEEFHPFYGGRMEERDMAYHQGTVWTFPLGAWYLAYLKVHGYSMESKEEVKEMLETIESAMREGCIGQLPEIYDGENPVSSKGCFAQAWSVGEILRVYEAIEK